MFPMERNGKCLSDKISRLPWFDHDTLNTRTKMSHNTLQICTITMSIKIKIKKYF
jgi:hypothetical protein